MKHFLEENEQVIYKPQKSIKMFLLISSGFIIYSFFILLGLFMCFYAFKDDLSFHNISVLIFLISAIILYAGIWINVLSDFLFVNIYVTNKKIIITNVFSKKNQEILYDNIENYFSFAYTSICIKEKDGKNHIVAYIKTPDILLTKITEQSPFAISTTVLYKNKTMENLLIIFMSIPYFLLFFLLLFNLNHIKEFYYIYQGNRFSAQCSSNISVEDCAIFQNSPDYKKNISIANNYYLKALEYNPKNIQLYHTLSNNYAHLDKYNAGISLLKNGLMQNPEYSKSFYYSLGFLYEKNKEYDLAINSFEKSLSYIKEDKNKAFAYIQLESLYLKSGKKEKAKHCVEQIENLSKNK